MAATVAGVDDGYFATTLLDYMPLCVRIGKIDRTENPRVGLLGLCKAPQATSSKLNFDHFWFKQISPMKGCRETREFVAQGT